MKTNMATTPSKTALEKIIEEAESFRDMSQRRGTLNQNIYYTLGVVGAGAGFLAGVSAANDSLQILSGIAGVLAGLIAAVQTFLTRKEKSRFQYDNAADAAEVALTGRILTESEERPTQDQILELAKRLTAIRRRPFDYRPETADGGSRQPSPG